MGTQDAEASAQAPSEETTKHGFCTLCRSRCGALYTISDGRMTDVRPDPDHPTGQALCSKGRAAPEMVHDPRRVLRPLRRTRPKTDPDPGWEEITWEEALDETARQLSRIRDQHGAEAVGFSVTSPSGTPMSDSIDWVERFIRTFGSPNTSYSTEICNWHKDHAHAFTFGRGMPTADYAEADLILLWGHNPARTWLSQSTVIGKARARGAQVAVVDPRKSGSAQTADQWLRVRPGTDGALALGLANLLIDSRRFDEDFVARWTNGPLLVRKDTGDFLRARDVEALAQEPGGQTPDSEAPTHNEADAAEGFVIHEAGRVRAYVPSEQILTERPELRGEVSVPLTSGSTVRCRPAFDLYADVCAQWPVERVAAETWIAEKEIRDLGSAIGAAQKIAYHAWSGVGQHTNATQTERAIASLYALTGCYDAPGGNVVWTSLPVNAVTSPAQLAPEQRSKAIGLDERPLGPASQGWVTAEDLYGAVLEEKPYPVRALMGFGANMLVSQPDSDRGREALQNLEFHVHCNVSMNPTAELADIILPVNTPWEREALRTGFEISQRAQEHLQLRQRMVAPVGESRSDTEIVFDLAVRLGMGESFFDGSMEAAWNHVLEPLGVTSEDLRSRPAGLRIPLEAKYRKYADTDERGRARGFETPTGRVELYSERLLSHGYDPLPRYVEPSDTPDQVFPYVLSSTKNAKFRHTQDRGVTSLRKRTPEPQVEISRELAATEGIDDGEWVILSTRHGDIRMTAHIDESLHPSVVVSEYGWWQAAPDLGLPGYDPFSAEGSNFNRIQRSSRRDPVSGAAPLKSTACAVVPDRLRNSRTWTGRNAVRVVDVVREGPETSSFVFARDDGTPMADFTSGQHINLHLDPGAQGGSVSRSYSLSSSTDTAGYRITVRADGAVSRYLNEHVRAGQVVEIEAPSGKFRLPPEPDLPVVLIAGGTGITPFASYLETMRGANPDAEIHLLYSSRDGGNHIFGRRMRELAGQMPGLSVTTYFTRPRPEDRAGDHYDRAGRLRAEDVEESLIRRRARFYICGPEQMMRSMREGLRSRGVPAFDIFEERFSAPVPTWEPDPEARHTVTFQRSGRELEWQPSDGSLLDLAEQHELPIPGGCRAGQCESCSVRVVSGTVRYYVPDADPDDDENCLTCQAVPSGDLTLDV